jgi:hypothetical protein
MPQSQALTHQKRPINVAKRRKQTETRYRDKHRAIINARNRASCAAKRRVVVNRWIPAAPPRLRAFMSTAGAMSLRIITLGQINEALRCLRQRFAQLAELGFQPWITEPSARACRAKDSQAAAHHPHLPAEACPRFALPLLQRLAPAAAPAIRACPPFERKCADDTEGGGTD